MPERRSGKMGKVRKPPRPPEPPVEITEDDLARAKQAWREDAPPEAQNILDAREVREREDRRGDRA